MLRKIAGNGERSMNSIPEKRQHARRAAFIIAEYTIEGETHRDVIKNIGANGLFVKTWRKFTAEQSVILKFPLFNFDSIIRVTGTILRNDHDGFAVAFDKPIKGLICNDGHLPEIVHEVNRPASR